MPHPQLQPVQVNEILRGVVKLYQAQLQAPGRAPIECKLELDESLGTIAADPDLLHRALSNLVLNAMDAMPNGGTLTLRSRRDDGKVIIEVADTGSGLTREECERIFTPYYTSKQHGTGLGLAIVQSVVSDHGGRISVQSEPGRGTTFVIELPGNTRCTAEDEGLNHEGHEGSRREPKSEEERLPLKAHLLIVDDEANTLASLSRAFRLAGHEATVCDNAAKALELAKAQNFDLILSDVVMPGKDGLTLLEELKRQGVTRAGGDDVGAGAHRNGSAGDAAGRARFSGEADLHRQTDAHGGERAQAATTGEREPATAAAAGQARDRVEGRGHAAGDGATGARGRQRVARVHFRRDWHGQGTGGANDSRTQPARGWAVS